METTMPTQQQQSETIKVTFELTLETTELPALKKAFIKARAGSAEREAIFAQIKAMHEYAKTRLDGECLAYMNIAKKRLQELYRLDTE